MGKKILVPLVFIVVAIIVVSLWLSNASLILSRVEKKFLEANSFTADSTIESRAKLFYKRPNNYKVVNGNNKTIFLLSKGIFLYSTGDNQWKKVDANMLNGYEKKMFYTQIPPFAGIFYASVAGNPFSLKGKERVNGREALHFFVDRAAGGSRLKIDFWVDQKTGVLVKYADEEGHSDAWTNIQINAPVTFDAFISALPVDAEVEDVTANFILGKK